MLTQGEATDVRAVINPQSVDWDVVAKTAYLDATGGYFEWTPDQTVVDHADSQPYSFSFLASDGSASSAQTVQVRVFDAVDSPQSRSHCSRKGFVDGVERGH